jgi:glycosyltransferase involved in cell wall biosynthesis
MTGVSVVVPTFDGEAFVGAALESILSQQHQPLEVIVCDDGSTDGTLAILESFGERIRLLRQPNAGVSAARNLAAREARGELLAFLDQDDLWEPEHLRVQVELLGRRPDCGLAYADSRVIDAADTPHGLRSEHLHFAEGHIFESLLQGNFIPIETLVMRRDLFRELGGFRTDYTLLEDYELCLRAARRSPAALTRRPLARYRVHGRNVTYDMEGILREYVRALEEVSALDLTASERAQAGAALRRRHAELAWYALRRLDLREADLSMERAREGGTAALRWKVRVLRQMLRILPSPMDRALVALLPRRKIYGV